MGALMHGLLSLREPATMEGGAMMPPSPSGPPGPHGPPHETAQMAPDDGRAPRATPFWMDVTPAQPQVRTGVTAARNSGLHTFGFFAIIIFVVGAAGFLGIAVWGPEKTVKSRSRLATDPPPAMTMPSLPASADTAVPAVASPASPTPTEGAASAPADNTKKKKGGGRGKKH